MKRISIFAFMLALLLVVLPPRANRQTDLYFLARSRQCSTSRLCGREREKILRRDGTDQCEYRRAARQCNERSGADVGQRALFLGLWPVHAGDVQGRTDSRAPADFQSDSLRPDHAARIKGLEDLRGTKDRRDLRRLDVQCFAGAVCQAWFRRKIRRVSQYSRTTKGKPSRWYKDAPRRH